MCNGREEADDRIDGWTDSPMVELTLTVKGSSSASNGDTDRVLLWVDTQQFVNDLLYIGAQTFVGILPWIAVSMSQGRLQAPAHQLKAFGGGSGLLAFAFSPAANRVQFGPELVDQVTVTPITEVVPTAAVQSAQSAWSVLFPSVK